MNREFYDLSADHTRHSYLVVRRDTGQVVARYPYQPGREASRGAAHGRAQLDRVGRNIELEKRNKIMKHYHIDALGFTGSAEDLVHQLHKASRSPAKSDPEFMVQVAERLRMSSGVAVRTDEPEHFVDDLIARDLVRGLVEQ